MQVLQFQSKLQSNRYIYNNLCTPEKWKNNLDILLRVRKDNLIFYFLFLTFLKLQKLRKGKRKKPDSKYLADIFMLNTTVLLSLWYFRGQIRRDGNEVANKQLN